MGKISGEEGWISLGPWGGKRGVYSTYKPDGPIVHITIRHGNVVHSILFQSKSRDEGVIGNSVKIGGEGGYNSPAEFCIDSSVEQFSSVSLTYEDYKGSVVVTSLCFNTNLEKYGPYGSGGGHSVFIPIEGEVITGFHGRGERYLDAIGIFVAPKVDSFPNSEININSLHSIEDPDSVQIQLKGKIIAEEGWISLGPWGGEGGGYETYKPDGPVIEITICYGDVIDSILFESKSRDGVVIGSSRKIGGTGGGASAKLYIDSSVEQFSSVSLTYKDYSRHVVVTSLCFNTNLKKYGPFGSGGGHSMSIPIEGGVIAGFHGRGGNYLDAIGIFVAPKADSLHSIQDPDSASTQLKDKIGGGEGCISLGPWGGNDGEDWAYKTNGPIMQISIRYGQAIDSILFESKSWEGILIGSPKKIGSSGGHATETFCIDTSEEQLSAISLTYEYFSRKVTIISLCICTNKNKYGPFGLRSGASSLSIPIPIEGGV